MSPAYLSKVENGEFAPPAEKKIRALAEVLELNVDLLFALAGRIPNEIRAIIHKHPEAWADFLRKAQHLSDEDIRELGKKFHNRSGPVSGRRRRLRVSV